MQKFSWPIRVYYEDTDAGGVVYHSNYLNFLERARTEMLRDLGFEQTELRSIYKIVFVVHALTIVYQKPAYFNDLLRIDTEITDFKKSRLLFTQQIYKDEQPLCRADVGVACVNIDTMRPTAIPPILLKLLNNE